MKNLILFTLICFFSIETYCQIVIELSDIKNPSSIKAKKEIIVIVDEFKINVYSTNPLKLISNFGSQGTGKGEFKYPPAVYIFDTIIVASDYTKTTWFTHNGRFIKEKQYSDFEDFSTSMEMQIVPFRENFIKAWVNHDLHEKHISLLNSEYLEIKSLYKGLYDWGTPIPRDITTLTNYNMLHHQIDFDIYNDKIFISDSEKGFMINKYDRQGNLELIIDKNKDFPETKVDSTYMKKALDEFKRSSSWIYTNAPKDIYRFSETFPSIEYFQLSDLKIYVTTYIEDINGRKIVCLDTVGKIEEIISIDLPSFKYYKYLGALDLYSINNGKIYEILKNDNNSYNLQIRDIKSEESTLSP